MLSQRTVCLAVNHKACALQVECPALLLQHSSDLLLSLLPLAWVGRHLAARHARLMALVHEVAGDHGSVGGRGSSAGGGNPLHHRYFLGESDEEDED